MLQWTFGSIKPIFSPLRIPIAKRGGLASSCRPLIQGSCCSQQCPWSLVQSWREWIREPGAIGGGAGPKEVKYFSQNVLTHDQETTRLVKTFPSLSPMIKRGAGSSSAKSPFCRRLEPEPLMLSESTPWADTIAQGAIAQAFSYCALTWPHRWVEMSCFLFFSYSLFLLTEAAIWSYTLIFQKP